MYARAVRICPRCMAATEAATESQDLRANKFPGVLGGWGDALAAELRGLEEPCLAGPHVCVCSSPSGSHFKEGPVHFHNENWQNLRMHLHRYNFPLNIRHK